MKSSKHARADLALGEVDPQLQPRQAAVEQFCTTHTFAAAPFKCGEFCTRKVHLVQQDLYGQFGMEGDALNVVELVRA